MRRGIAPLNCAHQDSRTCEATPDGTIEAMKLQRIIGLAISASGLAIVVNGILH